MSRVSVAIPNARPHQSVDERAAVVGSTNKTVAITTLGCKVNAYESELIGQSLIQQQWRQVPPRESADLFIINTCTVTQEADRQARQQVRRAIRQNPNAVVIVTGCYAQIEPHACAEIPGVDLVLGNDQKLDVHKLLPALLRGELPQVMVGDLDQQVSLPDQLITGYQAQTRAFVQIQQGCDQGCTFCIIHRARGPSRSLPPTLIKRQVQRLVLNGYKEIVICGVDLGSYGDDLGCKADSINLSKLIRELLTIEGEFRIRLSSIDPAHLSDELISLMAAEAKLCPHLHLSLQSGHTLILKRMKRRYTCELVRTRVEHLREQIPGLVLSADIMVGFPTESEEHFFATVEMVTSLEIAFPHVFVYSPRRDTPAAKIPRQVPIPERKRRAAHLRSIGDSIRQNVLNRQIGTTFRALIEGGGNPPPGYQRARLANYLPVWVKSQAGEAGQWCDVQIRAVENDVLIAR